MLKKSIGISLLALSANSYANIAVTTTEDSVKNDDVCSLREAVTYVNEYLSDNDKKTAGYNGCGSKDPTTLNNIIELEADKTYPLNSAIAIKTAMTIQTANNNNSIDTAQIGLHNATAVAKGQFRVFTIDDEKTDIGQIAVNLNQINLQGCAATACEQQGGIIFNREALTLQYTKLTQGHAVSGGAIYNAGIISGSNAGSAGYIIVNQSILQNNNADNGAVIYSEQPLYQVNNSIIRDNIARMSGGAILYSAIAFDDATTTTASFGRIAKLTNSTLFNNSGYLMNMRDGLYANNITAINNSAGIYFDAPAAKAHLSNSILVNNGLDCGVSGNNKSGFYNNLVGDSCAAGDAGNPNIYWSKLSHNKLIAGNSLESSSCDLPPADGLLCPFNTPKDYFLGFFRPRLLSAYTQLADSPIINRGRLYSDGSNLGLFSCESNDQRGLNRSNSIQCDLGAIELLVSPSNIARVGQDLLYGQVASLDISNDLADGELLPAADCPAVLGSVKDPKGQPWKNGCLRIEQSSATPTSKGSLVLAANGMLTYTPNSNWHGLDEFNLRVVTTASRFSDAISDRDIVIPVRIVQAPPNDFANQTLKVKGGAMGIFGLMGLVALAIRRRNKI